MSSIFNIGPKGSWTYPIKPLCYVLLVRQRGGHLEALGRDLEQPSDQPRRLREGVQRGQPEEEEQGAAGLHRHPVAGSYFEPHLKAHSEEASIEKAYVEIGPLVLFLP